LRDGIPVVSSALAVGFLVTTYIAPVMRRFLALCAIVLAIQVAVFGAPALAPMLFPNLALLCRLGLGVLRDHVPKTETSE
jgi:hypothetical protein